MNNISDKDAINAKLGKWYEENKARYNLQDKFAAMLVWQASYESCLSEFEQIGTVYDLDDDPQLEAINNGLKLETPLFTRKG